MDTFKFPAFKTPSTSCDVVLLRLHRLTFHAVRYNWLYVQSRPVLSGTGAAARLSQYLMVNHVRTSLVKIMRYLAVWAVSPSLSASPIYIAFNLPQSTYSTPSQSSLPWLFSRGPQTSQSTVENSTTSRGT